MLTKLVIRNLKRFDEVEIELGSPVVFIGPNNSGKSTALQALALWEVGIRRWAEKRGGGQTAPEKRPGVAIGRRDLLAVPVPSAALLWRGLHTRATQRQNGSQGTRNIRIDVIVAGITSVTAWQCGLEFDYANEESFYCRPLRSDDDGSERMPVPPEAAAQRVAYLAPMSGLASNEVRLDQGAINVRLGEGRTAEVLRNLCYLLAEQAPDHWDEVRSSVQELFGVRLDDPAYVQERGEVEMTYREGGTLLDLSCAGRGLQQTLLLLAHMNLNPGSVLLLDEPDAHLEILRQRQIFQMLCEAGERRGSQVIAASHSEVILNEAADRATVVAFVGRPHRISDRGTQVAKALKAIGFEQYYQAEQTGWVLYLEGSTDLAILRRWAEILQHPAASWLARPFVHYVANQPQKAREHLHGLREAKPDLVGVAVFDRLERPFEPDAFLQGHMWRKNEIECYLCVRSALLEWAEQRGREQAGPLFAAQWREAMESTITKLEGALMLLGKPTPWGDDLKASDEFFAPLFRGFHETLGVPNTMDKSDYHELAALLPAAAIDSEITVVLDLIASTAERSRPASDTA